jgi:hypothetical protein
MPNLVNVTYDQTGKSKSTNALGMREMQENAYAGRNVGLPLLNNVIPLSVMLKLVSVSQDFILTSYSIKRNE